MKITQNFKKILHTKAESKVTMILAGNIPSGASVSGDPLPSYFPDSDNYYVLWTNNNLVNINNAQGSTCYASTSVGVNNVTTGLAVESIAYATPGGKIDISATGGGSNYINTNLTAATNAVGKKIRIIAGPGAGNEYTIKYNTVTTNSTIYIDSSTPVVFDATTKFQLITGSYFMFSPGTLSATSCKVFDAFTNSNYALSVTGLPTTWGTEGQLVRQHTITDNHHTSAVSSSTTTVTTISTAFTGIGYNWTNYEVEIISGTGAGQYRTISSTTGNTITVSSAWTITPDSTSVIRIKGNRNYLYLFGNGAVTAYRFDISTNTWTTLAPTTVRAGAFSSGGTADVINCKDWNIPEVISGKPGGQNGRFIYSFRGNSSIDMDIYDIATNNWGNGLQYGNKSAGIDGGSCSVADGRYIYIMVGSSRIQRFDVVAHKMEPWHQLQYSPATTINGDKMWMVYLPDDNGNIVKWIYYIPHSRDVIMRIWVHSGD